MTSNDWQTVQYSDEQRVIRFTNRNRYIPLLGSLILGALLIGVLTFWHEEVASALGIHRPILMLEHAGGIQLSASRLIDHVPLAMHAGHKRYWLGPLAGSTYTTNCVTPGILKVSYFKANQTFDNGSRPLLVITAYENRALYDRRLHPLSIDLATDIANSHGDLLNYDTASLTELTIQRNSSQEIITINYSTPQSVVSMVHDSEKLVAL